MQLVRLCELDVMYEFLQYTGTNNSDNALSRTLQYPHIGSLSRVISGGLSVAMCVKTLCARGKYRGVLT